MYSYVAPSRPVFYVLLCIDVSDFSQDEIALGVTDSSTTVHHHLRKDTASKVTNTAFGCNRLKTSRRATEQK
jgi:hypothetical protein